MQPRLIVIIFFLFFFGYLGSAKSDDRASHNEMVFQVGTGGFVSAWLQLGPIPKKKQGAIRSGEVPKATDGALVPHDGAKTAFGKWQGLYQRSLEFVLDGRRKAVRYLAAVVRVDAPGIYWLSTGSTGSINVLLNGGRVFRQNGARRAFSDTDLIRLDMAQGDNLLVLKLTNDNGPNWRTSIRLMQSDFLPATKARIVLPGVDKNKLPYIIQQMARLELNREVDLMRNVVEVGARLVFPGGVPSLEKTSIRLHLSDIEVSEIGRDESTIRSAQNGRVYLGNFVITDEMSSEEILVSVGGTSLKKAIGFRMDDVHKLAKAQRHFEQAKSSESIEKSTVDSMKWRLHHLVGLLESGDDDYAYLNREISNTLRMAEALAKGIDPYFEKRGQVQRRGYRSSLDGKLHPYVLYVPPAWREEGEHKYALVVMLHGLRAPPMKALQSVFGLPLDDKETNRFRGRHPKPVSHVPYFVLAPMGFGASAYREFGEVDVMEVLAEVRARYRIHPNKIYITGSSMGGIGAASIPLHYPDIFAGAAPLCGYHSYFVYRGMKGIQLLPWEQFLLEVRSNVEWAANGKDLFLYAVHGLKDTPGHTGVLVDRFRKLNYKVKFETIDSGHNVWDKTYRDRRIFNFFSTFKRKPHPRKLTFRTGHLRYRKSHWLAIDDVVSFDRWAEVDAVWEKDNRIGMNTKNISALTIDNNSVLRNKTEFSLSIDGQELSEIDSSSDKWHLTKRDGKWSIGTPSPCKGVCKRPGLSGPIRDAYHEPLIFVYGTAIPGEERLAKRLIARLRRPRRGVTIDWKVKADVEITESDIQKYSLVIVGTTKGNRVLQKIASLLPIKVDDGSIVVGKNVYNGQKVAASYVYPNPLNPERYVVIHTGVSLQGLFYVGHLPEILPDYIVYDASSWGEKGGRVLKGRPILKAGFFNREWKLNAD